MLCILVLAAVAGRAHAEDARIADALHAYQAHDQERTIALLAPLVPALHDHDRAMGLRLLGCAHMVLGDRPAAIAAFRQAFAIEPDTALELAIASPDARSLYEIARGEWRAALVTEMEKRADDVRRIALVVSAPSRSRGGQPIAIGVKLEDPAHLASRVELAFRRRGQPTFTQFTQRFDAARAITFAIPADATESASPFALEYHVTVRHETGLDLRRDGDPDRPHVIAVGAGHRPRWHESWLVRGAFALGVVGLAAGGYLYYRSLDVGGQHVTIETRP
jgi:hypothetical protein